MISSWQIRIALIALLSRVVASRPRSGMIGPPGRADFEDAASERVLELVTLQPSEVRRASEPVADESMSSTGSEARRTKRFPSWLKCYQNTFLGRKDHFKTAVCRC